MTDPGRVDRAILETLATGPRTVAELYIHQPSDSHATTAELTFGVFRLQCSRDIARIDESVDGRAIYGLTQPSEKIDEAEPDISFRSLDTRDRAPVAGDQIRN
jgi:hypothetical protein